jgi:c-di-GMP-binding flagellar brake protein YcgR
VTVIDSGRSRLAEHRRSPRLRTNLRGILNGRTRHEIEIVELSITGCLARSQKAFDTGRILDLELYLGDASLSTKVRIIETCVNGDAGGDRPTSYLVGLSFLTIPSMSEYRLRLFIDKEKRRLRQRSRREP